METIYQHVIDRKRVFVTCRLFLQELTLAGITSIVVVNSSANQHNPDLKNKLIIIIA